MSQLKTIADAVRLLGGTVASGSESSLLEQNLTPKRSKIPLAIGVSAAFQPDKVAKRYKLNASELENLKIASRPLPVEGDWWTLNADEQRKLLEGKSRKELAVAVKEVGRVPVAFRPVQAALVQLLNQKAVLIEKCTLEQAQGQRQAVGLLSDIIPDLPSINATNRRIEYLNRLKELERMGGSHFRGRTKEQAILRKYVTAKRSPGTNFAKCQPLIVHGPGGVGKSALLAHFALELSKKPGSFRFAVFDFDRPDLKADEPLTLLREAVSQFVSQQPDRVDDANRMLDKWSERLRESSASTNQSSANIRVYERFILDFVDFFQLNSPPAPRGIFLFDTFEVVQNRSRVAVGELWRLFARLSQLAPQLRIIMAGRATVTEFRDFSEYGQLQPQTLPLSGLDAEAAIGILVHRGVDAALARRLEPHLRGHPLSLAIAASVVAQTGGGNDIEEVVGSVTAERIQSELFRRYLFGLDAELSRVVYPGLAVRLITPEVISKVLAGPCKLPLKSRADADALYDRIIRNVDLLERTDNGYRHRSDLRKLMLPLLSAAEPAKVKEIHRLAAKHHKGETAPHLRAERLYHLLQLEEFETAGAEWSLEAGETLGDATDELPTNAQAWLRSRLDVELTPQHSASSDLETWEIHAERIAAEALQIDKPDEALQVLAERRERTHASRLLILEAEALRRKLRFREAYELAVRAISEGDLRSETYRLHLLLCFPFLPERRLAAENSFALGMSTAVSDNAQVELVLLMFVGGLAPDLRTQSMLQFLRQKHDLRFDDPKLFGGLVGAFAQRRSPDLLELLRAFPNDWLDRDTLEGLLLAMRRSMSAGEFHSRFGRGRVTTEDPKGVAAYTSDVVKQMAEYVAAGPSTEWFDAVAAYFLRPYGLSSSGEGLGETSTSAGAEEELVDRLILALREDNVERFYYDLIEFGLDRSSESLAPHGQEMNITTLVREALKNGRLAHLIRLVLRFVPEGSVARLVEESELASQIWA